jgi:hypothetical protein
MASAKTAKKWERNRMERGKRWKGQSLKSMCGQALD